MLWMVVLQWKSKKKDLSEVRGRADEGRKREEGKEGDVPEVLSLFSLKSVPLAAGLSSWLSATGLETIVN